MARKATEDLLVNEEVTSEKIEKNDDKVTLTIPAVKTTDEEPNIFVGLNGKNYIVKKGATVEMPRAVAEIIINSIEAEQEAVEAKISMSKVKEVLI